MHRHDWRHTMRLYYAANVATLGFYAFGYHLGEFNNISTLLPCQDPNWPETAPPAPYLGIPLPVCIPMSTVQFSFANAVFPLAGVLGALAGGPMAHSLGRIRAMMLFVLFLIVAPVVLALASSYAWLLVGRSLAGIGSVGITTVIPVYLSEISPPPLRGRIGNISSVMINVGLAIAPLAGWYWADSAPAWRSIVGLSLPTSIAQLVGLFFCPESPTWLDIVGRRGEAEAIRHSLGHDVAHPVLDNVVDDGPSMSRPSLEDDLTAVATMDAKLEDASKLAALDRLVPPSQQHQLDNGVAAAPSVESMSVLEFLRDPAYRSSLIILALAHSAQQFSGNNTYFVYSFFILMLIMTPEHANLFYLIFAFGQIPINYFPGLFIDRTGRRPLILGTMAVMAACAVLFTVSVAVHSPIMSIAMFIAAVSVCAVGLSNVPFILMAEVTDTRSVAAASTVSIVINTLSNFVVLFVFPLLLDSLHEYTFLLFAGYLAVSGLALATVLPETLGRSNEEVMAELKVGIRRA
ncbi:major facilitator superfamily domain-containing protein [Blastocladiella britannica]|nr:major facilitator superfamily domain-containing protein [Blastocladiella britannica]